MHGKLNEERDYEISKEPGPTKDHGSQPGDHPIAPGTGQGGEGDTQVAPDGDTGNRQGGLHG